MQVLVSYPVLLAESEQLAEHADIALMLSSK